MGFTSVGTLGTVSSTTADQSSLVLTTSATLEANNLGVLIVAVDNNAAVDGDEGAVSGVVDSAGNTWSKAGEFTNSQGSAKAGATCSVWYCRVPLQLASGGTITASFTNATSRDAAAAAAWEFTVTGSVSVEATNTLADDGSDATSLDATTANIECLRIRAMACERGTGTAVSANTATWTNFTGTTTSNAGVGGMSVFGEFLISTATGAASNPTLNATMDIASVYVALKIAGTAYTLTSDAGSFTLAGKATLQKVSRLSSAGSYVLTGIAAGLKAAYLFACTAGSYVLTGKAAAQAISILHSTGSYVLTGIAATLVSTALQTYALAAAAGSYVVSGIASLKQISRLSSVGVYTYTGFAATLSKIITMVADRGIYVLTGLPGTVLKSTRHITAVTGSYVLTGKNVTLTFLSSQAKFLVAATGSYVVTGSNVILAFYPRIRQAVSRRVAQAKLVKTRGAAAVLQQSRAVAAVLKKIRSSDDGLR